MISSTGSNPDIFEMGTNYKCGVMLSPFWPAPIVDSSQAHHGRLRMTKYYRV
jgi:hypothetical protein